MDAAAQTPTARFVAWLIRWRLPLLLLGVGMAAASWFPSRRLQFDQSVERMFPVDDPLLPPYRELKQKFGGNEVVLAVYADPNAMAVDGSGIDRARRLSEAMAKVPGVQEVLSIAQLNDLLEKMRPTNGLLNLFGGGKRNKWDGPALLNPKNEMSKRFRELFQGYTHSVDGQTLAVVCILDPHLPAEVAGSPAGTQQPTLTRLETVRQLRAIVEQPGDGLPPGVVAGEPVMVAEGFAMLDRDGKRLGLWSSVLLGLTILICFRSLRWLVVPIAVVQWTLLLTRAILALSGVQLTMVSSMLTAIVTVIGVAAVVHLIVHYQQLREKGISAHDALQLSGARLAWPIVGACFTDVAGFASLQFADVGPVSDFGTMMGLGSLLVLFALMLLTPGLILIGQAQRKPNTNASGNGAQHHAKQGWLDRWLSRNLASLVVRVQRHPRPIAVVAVLLTIIAIIGSTRLRVETDFTRNFRANSTMVQSYEFIEQRLGGAGVWDVIVPAPPRLNAAYVDRVRQLEEKLRAIELPAPWGAEGSRPALTKVISVVDLLDAAAGERSLALIPPEARAVGMAAFLPKFMQAMRTTELDVHGQAGLRIMLRAHERQPAEQKRQLIDEVTRIVQEEFPATETQTGGRVTGLFVMLTSIVESMLRDQWITFAAASASIGLMMLVSLRSVKLALIALVPNLLPILLVMGLWGMLGLKINMGAAMIAAVSMGLSIDSSIHYLVDFLRERRSGKSFSEALSEAQSDVGRAMIYTTLAVIIGFGVLTISEFVPTVYFGALVSLTMLGGLAGNLVVLPWLLHMFARRDGESSPAKPRGGVAEASP